MGGTGTEDETEKCCSRDPMLHDFSMPNTHRRRRRDATVELSRVGGVYWIRN